MVETWRDSWFEEGSRLIYIVPSRAIDAILPLQIEPGEILPDLASFQTEPLGVGEDYEADLRRLVSLLRRDYQLRQRERVS